MMQKNKAKILILSIMEFVLLVSVVQFFFALYSSLLLQIYSYVSLEFGFPQWLDNSSVVIIFIISLLLVRYSKISVTINKPKE